MDLDFSLDFDSQEIILTIDNSTTIAAEKDDDGKILYKRLERLDEELQNKVKQIFKIMFSMEEV